MRRLVKNPSHLSDIIGVDKAWQVYTEEKSIKFPIEIEVTDEMSFVSIMQNDTVEKEYSARYRNREAIEKIINSIELHPKSASKNGSHYSYLGKIGEYYFTHSDFITALTQGKHSFYAFSESLAREYLKKHYKEQYKALSKVIDLRYCSRTLATVA